MISNFFKKAAAVSVMLALLAGCSGERRVITYTEEAAATTQPEVSLPADTSFRTALLLPVDPKDGAVMSAAHANAYLSAASDLGIDGAVTVVCDNAAIPDSAATAGLVFGASFDYMNLFDESAKSNSEVMYSCFDGYKYNSTNYSNYYAAVFEAEYLAGVAAAYNSKTGKIGVLAEYTTEYPDTAASINGFALGALSVNPNATVVVRSLSSRTDFHSALLFTRAMIVEGCDVVNLQCDTDIPIKEAIARGVYFIGYGSDAAAYDEELCLTSVVWNLKDYYKSAMSAARDDTWPELGNFYGDLSDGTVSLAKLSDTAADGTESRINAAADLINSGLLEVFSNRRLSFDSEGNTSVQNAPLYDINGNMMISENGLEYYMYNGDSLTPIEAVSATSDRLASASMNYLVDGILLRDE